MLKSITWKQCALWCWYGALSVVVAGLWFHTSQSRTIFAKYSLPYFGMALGASAICVMLGYAAWLICTPQQLVLSGGRKMTVSTRSKVLGTLLAFALALLVAEIGLTYVKARQLGARADLAGYHPWLQNVPVPGDQKFTINRWGFRGEEIELAKPAGAYRIFVLGGSTVFCEEVGFEQTHCRLLEKVLRSKYPNVQIEVQNAGCPWHTSQHSLLKYLTKVQDFSPDLIIVYHGVNDMARGFCAPYATRGEYQPDYGHFYGPVATFVHSYEENRSRFHPYVWDEMQKLLGERWFSDIRGTSQDERPVELKANSDWKSLPSFRRNLRNLAIAAKSQQVELIMASQPYFIDRGESKPHFASQQSVVNGLVRNAYDMPDVASLVRGMDEFNAASRAVAREHDLTFVELEKRVPKSWDNFVDDFHYTPEGNRLVAEALAAAIVDGRFVDRKFAGASSVAP